MKRYHVHILTLSLFFGSVLVPTSAPETLPSSECPGGNKAGRAPAHRRWHGLPIPWVKISYCERWGETNRLEIDAKRLMANILIAAGIAATVTQVLNKKS